MKTQLQLLSIAIASLLSTQLFSQQKTTAMNTEIIATVQNIFSGSDERNWEKVESAFNDKVVLDYTSMAGGEPATLRPHQITAAWKSLLPGFQSTHHQAGQFDVQVNGKSATVKNHGLALHYLPNNSGEAVWVVIGTYDFKLVKKGTAWKVSNMTFNLQQQEGNLQLPQLAKENVTANTSFKTGTPSKEATKAVEAFFASLEKLDIDAFMNVWAPDGKQVMPLSPANFPKQLTGKEAIYNQYKALPENYTSMKFPRKFFATSDPNTVIVQYGGIIPLKNGGEYNNNYVGLFHIKHGRVQQFTEYFDPFILEEAFGKKLESNFNVGGTASRKVAFKSEGLLLKGNLYLPQSFDETKKYKALVVTGSWTTVKEQMPALYAQKLAENGYVALTFDFRYFGESEGQPREYENPADKIKDIQRAVDYLAALPFVDADNMAGMGVCASTGYMSYAAAADSRLKTIVLVAPWLHNAALIEAIYSSRPGGVNGLLERSRAAAKQFAEKGTTSYVAAASTTDPLAAMYLPDPVFDYYLNPKKGAIPEWNNNFAEMSWKPWLTFDGIASAKSIQQPVLLVHSENGAIPQGARLFYEGLSGEKEFIWIKPKFNQLDMYFVPDAITEATAPAIAWLHHHLN
jgi:ketosteroid isomerase-like protein/fermentation-respiration switch protein FrsA (DUF1100 family)